jgi:hypothetical protein
VPRGYSFRSVVVLGVKESNPYRLKGQPMRAMASSSKVTKVKEQVTLKVVQTRRELDFRRSQQIQSLSDLRRRVNHSEGIYPQVQVGERHLPRRTRRYHGLRKPGRRLRSGRLLGIACLPKRIHAIQQVLFP